jgi:hypothetical protein
MKKQIFAFLFVAFFAAAGVVASVLVSQYVACNADCTLRAEGAGGLFKMCKGYAGDGMYYATITHETYNDFGTATATATIGYLKATTGETDTEDFTGWTSASGLSGFEPETGAVYYNEITADADAFIKCHFQVAE